MLALQVLVLGELVLAGLWGLAGGDGHDDGFGLGEELAAERAPFAADARVAEPAERRPQVPDEEAVRLDGPGAQRG